MNFLAPLFLLGALAIAGPVILHLIRRTSRERQRFSSLMFLDPTPPRLTKRSRIENWLLLLLRAGVLALLALAFARPFFRATVPPGTEGNGGDRTLVLVDASASLRREGLWEAAKERALKAVESAAAGGDVALTTFDRATASLLKFEDWHGAAPDSRLALARERLDTASPSWNGTNTAAALMAAAEMLSESGSNTTGKRDIVLVTDAQEGGRLEALQGYDWPKNVSLRLEIIPPKTAGNAGLQLAADTGPAREAAVPGVRLRVTNSPDAGADAFLVGWRAASGEFEGKPVDVYVPPGQSRIAVLPWPESGPKAGQVVLRGDAADFDNIVNVTPPPSVNVPVIHSGGGADSRGPLYFLQKALPESRALTATVQPLAPAEIPPPEILKTAPLWIITAPLETQATAAARAYLENGGTILVMLSGVDMAGTLQTLTGTASLPLTEVTPPRQALLGNIDFGHPLFSAFADPRFSDFTKIRFLNYRRLDPNLIPEAKVAARFDTGDPAVLEVARGKGRVFVLAAGWHPASSQLALSSKFPALLASLLSLTGAGAPVPSQFIAGEPATGSSFLPAPAESGEVTGPRGATVTVKRSDAFTGFTEPGIYTVKWEGGRRDLAVNPDPAESRVTPLTVEDFEKLGVPVTTGARSAGPATPASESTAAAIESESRQKLWRWILVAVFAVLFIETLLGLRAARQYSTLEGGATT